MLYARMVLPTGDAGFEPRRGTDNELLQLPVEDFDEYTKLAVGIGERGEVATRH